MEKENLVSKICKVTKAAFVKRVKKESVLMKMLELVSETFL